MVLSDFEKLLGPRYEAVAEFDSLKIQDGKSFADYCDRIEYWADRTISLGDSRRYIEGMKRIKLMRLISEEYWYVADAEVCRAPKADRYKVLKNFIISYVRKLEENKELYSAGIVDICMTDIFSKPIILETPKAIPQESTLQEITVFKVEEQTVVTDDTRSDEILEFESLLIQKGQTLSDYCDCIEIVTNRAFSERPENLISLVKVEKLIILLTDNTWSRAEYEMSMLRVTDLEQFHWVKNWIYNEFGYIDCTDRSHVEQFYRLPYLPPDIFTVPQILEIPVNMEDSDKENESTDCKLKSQNERKVAKKEDHTVVSDILNFAPVFCFEIDPSFVVSKSLEDSCIESYGIDKEHTENDLEMDKVDQKAKDTNLGPPLNSNILENFQHCDSMSIVTTECSKTDYETEHETQIIDSPDIDYKNEDTDAIHKESTQMRSFTIQENSCDNENDKIEHITHESLNNQIQKAGQQKPGDVACGGFFDNKMKRRVNEEMRPRTDPPTDLSQQACYGTVSDMLDWNNWSHENWKDMSWQRFVRESRPRKDPPWSSCRSEVGICYGWRWDVSQEPSCSQDYRSRHVMFTPRQAAEVQ